MILETVQVLVAFPTDLAPKGFLLFHAQGAGVGGIGLGIDDGESSVCIVMEGLIVMAMLLKKKKVH